MCSLFASYIFIWTNKRWRWWWWWICVFVFLNSVMCGRTVMKHARRRKKSARLRWANTGDERVSDREGALAAAASVGWRARRLLLRKLLTWAPSSAAIFSASFWAGCSALVSVGMPVNSSWRLRVDGGEQELDSRRQTLVLYHTCPPSAISSRIQVYSKYRLHFICCKSDSLFTARQHSNSVRLSLSVRPSVIFRYCIVTA